MFADFFTLGKKTAKSILQLLLVIGLVPIALYAVQIGGMTSAIFPSDVTVDTGSGMYTTVRGPNYFLGGFLGILAFVMMAIVWKIVCELLLLICKTLEVYIQKNDTKQ